MDTVLFLGGKEKTTLKDLSDVVGECPAPSTYTAALMSTKSDFCNIRSTIVAASSRVSLSA
jgi:hypothetical protein